MNASFAPTVPKFFNTAGPIQPDIHYCVITIEKPRRISNGIYREVIPRELTWSTQTALIQQPIWYIRQDGGGYIDREYGLGRGRTDLLIRKPLTEQYGGPYQYIALELKIKRNSMTRTINEGLRQTAEYMDRCPEGTEGHFLIFDRSSKKPWSKRIFHRNCEFEGRRILVWGM